MFCFHEVLNNVVTESPAANANIDDGDLFVLIPLLLTQIANVTQYDICIRLEMTHWYNPYSCEIGGRGDAGLYFEELPFTDRCV